MIDYLKKLEYLRGLNGGGAGRDELFFARLKAVKSWQQQRLANTYRDLAADPRYVPAVEFFLAELYGPGESALRDRDLIRMYPTIKRVLPKFAFETVNKALELDVISEEFDQALTRELGSASITEANYIAAFRMAGSKQARLHQIELMREVGVQIERVVGKPLIYTTLRMLRSPARVAGLEHMQQFLEKGFTAFRHMNGAEYFLQTIASRETAMIERIFAGHPKPFQLRNEPHA